MGHYKMPTNTNKVPMAQKTHYHMPGGKEQSIGLAGLRYYFLRTLFYNKKAKCKCRQYAYAIQNQFFTNIM